MIDQIFWYGSWVIGLVVAAFSLRQRCSWRTALCFAAVAGGACWCALHFYARPATLTRQMAPVTLMASRLDAARQHLQARRLQAAESLSFQVQVEARQIKESRWTLPEIGKHCDSIQSDADKVFQKVGRLGSKAANELAQCIRQKEYESAVDSLKDAHLDLADGFGRSLQNFLCHVISDEMTSAGQCLRGLNSSAIDLTKLREIVISEQQAIQSRHASIAESVKEHAVAAKHTPGLKPVRRGRAMVWDFTTQSIEGAYQLLPDELRATSRDGVLTMFCIRKREQIEVGRYNISNQPAYQEHMEIAIVYWPSGECVGATTVLGGEPRTVREVQYSPEYGSSIQIKEWIERLPEDMSIPPARIVIRSLDDLQAQLKAQKQAELDRELAAANEAREAQERLEAQRREAQRLAAAKEKAEEQLRIAAEEAKESERLEEQRRVQQELIRRNAELEKSARSKFALAKKYLALDNPEKAKKYAQQAIEIAPQSDVAKQAQALLERLDGDLD